MVFQGWTWEYISENMTWSRLQKMRDYWEKHPPVHLVVAALAGVKSKPKPTSIEEEPPEFEA